MPELPEVETVRAGLDAHVLGRAVAQVQIRRDRAVRRHAAGEADFAARLQGRAFDAAVRRGKYLWLTLADGRDEALLVHLGMSGQLLVRSGPGDPSRRPGVTARPGVRPGEDGGELLARPEHLRARLVFADGGELWFVDQRTFGHLLVAPLVPTDDGGPGGLGSPLAALPAPVAHIARDLLDDAVAAGSPGRAALVRRVRARRTGIKRALLDQTLVSGIGNIYADEGLWRAAEHYERPAGALSRLRVGALLDAVAAVMAEALAAGGTSFDALYVNVNGASGYFDRSLAVYGQAGRPCPRCGAGVVRESFMNRSSFRCPHCQRAPRRTGGHGVP